MAITFRILSRINEIKIIKFNENSWKDNDFNLTLVANMDETPLFMSNTNTQLSPKYDQKRLIKTHGQERVHITVILWMVAYATKLSPMCVFKGKPFGRIEKESKSIN